ncbi:nuclear GTPase SLIP-GC-like [Menidia menidia]
MDDFVREKLTQWNLAKLIPAFEEHGIDKESLLLLDDKDIESLISQRGTIVKFRKNLTLLKGEEQRTNQDTKNTDDDSSQGQQQFEEATDLTEEKPSTSYNGKRKPDTQRESSEWQLPTKRRRYSTSEAIILFKVKTVMGEVYIRIDKMDRTKLNEFLRSKIEDLATDKRELVGVFGRTGTGKSSLINAVIGEKKLLPTGSVSACTSVMIKVEANMHNLKYEADIEFISKEEWKNELWSTGRFHGDNKDEIRKDEESREEDDEDFDEKLSAVYGDEWRDKSLENLMEAKYFREINQFLGSMKTLTSETARELSEKLVKYTRSGTKEGESKEVKSYWPLVKCVTLRVPKNDLLQYVTLVDLPGNGDCNKSRDEMWKRIVGKCSAVWIVTELNRATSEKESWEILKSVRRLIGNGGECQYILFICTKSDQIDDLDNNSMDNIRAHIFKRNMRAKEEVRQKFQKLVEVKKHISVDCFNVFTVSSKEFLKCENNVLNKTDSEIPMLQDFLKDLNDSHSETLNYVSGAHGILSLIQGANCNKAAGEKKDLCEDLEGNISHHLTSLRAIMDEVCGAFEKCLSKGVAKSNSSCEGKLESFLYPKGKSGRGFHKLLRCVVLNQGKYQPKKGKETNLNRKLASILTDSIDEEFKRTFPNDSKNGPIYEAINSFSLDTGSLMEKYKDLELQLIFLKTEEEKVKTKLKRFILDEKKIIYSSLTKAIEEAMTDCYQRAAGFRGKNSLLNMRQTVERHVHDFKGIMFCLAKGNMLKLLKELMVNIIGTLEETMRESIELSLKTEDNFIPDVSNELQTVQKLYDELT